MFRQLHHKHEFCIAACDGLWDEMSSDTGNFTSCQEIYDRTFFAEIDCLRFQLC